MRTWTLVQLATTDKSTEVTKFISGRTAHIGVYRSFDIAPLVYVMIARAVFHKAI